MHAKLEAEQRIAHDLRARLTQALRTVEAYEARYGRLEMSQSGAASSARSLDKSMSISGS
jgi:hypothetical protein